MPVTRDADYGSTLTEQFKTLQTKYPGIELKKTGEGWEVVIPAKYREGHESHFARVTEKFLEYVRHNDMPAWEVPDMIAKYYTTTRALQLARDTAPLLAPASDTLTAQVSEWSRLKVHPSKYGDSRTVLNGSTHDLSLLDVRAITLSAGQSLPEGSAGNPPAPPGGADELLIVREGRLSVTVKDSLKILSPGGVGLFPAGERPTLTNAGTSPVTFYLFRMQSRSSENQQRAREAGGPFLIDWPQMVMKPTAKGESRQIFSRPVAWLEKIDMHATTLNPGEVSHPPHTHRAEEIILLRSGHVQMHIGDQYYKAAGGDLVFLASGVPHALENRSKQRCEYFALQWQL
jgi:(S)-ureidoglycine aminohydrolase